MLSDVVILLHDNTHTALKAQELLRKFKWEIWIPPYSPDSANNLVSKNLSGTRFSSNSENSCRELAQWAELDFCQAGLNKLVRSSDKC
ncbi:hypothetical protein AVEN_105715-1 [Araneus ventricosus]|uniref:Tc1-like transposase DDE domain-containing protein n=1 Tax=Araneus ventricosus TaxID=182803 RepID=A0A4Y2AEJ7_ARAVE|nr:hypothetical protein AVEN_105715-1 [Araneus ventricosus]